MTEVIDRHPMWNETWDSNGYLVDTLVERSWYQHEWYCRCSGVAPFWTRHFRSDYICLRCSTLRPEISGDASSWQSAMGTRFGDQPAVSVFRTPHRFTVADGAARTPMTYCRYVGVQTVHSLRLLASGVVAVSLHKAALVAKEAAAIASRNRTANSPRALDSVALLFDRTADSPPALDSVVALFGPA